MLEKATVQILCGNGCLFPGRVSLQITGRRRPCLSLAALLPAGLSRRKASPGAQPLSQVGWAGLVTCCWHRAPPASPLRGAAGHGTRRQAKHKALQNFLGFSDQLFTSSLPSSKPAFPSGLVAPPPAVPWTTSGPTGIYSPQRSQNDAFKIDQSVLGSKSSPPDP